ncbi:MAG: type IV pilin-like G/H family protein [Microcoleus sp.]
MTKNQESSISNSSDAGCGCLLFIIWIIGGVVIGDPLSSRDTARKAKQSEAKQYVSSTNKGQQAYYAEKSVFGTSVEALKMGIITETKNYKYSVRATKKAAFSYGVSKQKELKSYVGGVFVVPAKEVVPNAAQNEIITTISILCEADKPGPIKPAEATYKNGKIACGKGTTELTK